MDKAEITKLAEKYQAKAEKAYMEYQETGMARYDRERKNAEDMAEVLMMAVNAADEHALLSHLKAELTMYAGQADRAIASCAEKEELVSILTAVISSATVYCKYARRQSV